MIYSFEERAGLCALNRILGFEPRVGLRLIEEFGGAEAVFREEGNARKVLASYSRARLATFVTESAFESAAMELEGLEGNGCRFVGISSLRM